MSEYSRAVDDFWGPADDGFRLVVDPAAAHDRRVSLLRRSDGGATATVSPAIAETIGRPQSETEFRDALAPVVLHEPDNLYYFPRSVRAELAAADGVRRLSAADAAAFHRFEAAAPEQDRDDAFVELDHWAVFGAFEGELLVSAASAYPWGESALADIGVLTLPDSRGRGHARTVVRALAAHALAEGFEPQYRCQLDNAGSIAVATSAGLTLFGTWEVVAPDSN